MESLHIFLNLTRGKSMLFRLTRSRQINGRKNHIKHLSTLQMINHHPRQKAQFDVFRFGQIVMQTNNGHWLFFV